MSAVLDKSITFATDLFAAPNSAWAGELAAQDGLGARAKAATFSVLHDAELAGALARLEQIRDDYLYRGVARPKSVSEKSLQALIAQGQQGFDSVAAARLDDGTMLVRTRSQRGGHESSFAILSDGVAPVVGLLTDRNLKEHWPEAWQDYDDMRGECVLDHCCGTGQKVALLRAERVRAFGVDITAIVHDNGEYVRFGRAERLPFPDGFFKRVESRMGVFLWSQEDVATCRQSLAEMVRVTERGGHIRICPVKPELIQVLAEERSDIILRAGPLKSNQAWEIEVCP